nr:unnamed protein product [Digitaria exilis]
MGPFAMASSRMSAAATPASTSLPITLTASASRSGPLPRAPSEAGACATAFLLPPPPRPPPPTALPPRAPCALPLEEGGGGTRSSVEGSARGTDVAGGQAVGGSPSLAGAGWVHKQKKNLGGAEQAHFYNIPS